MIIIKISIKSSRKEVQKFLNDLKILLNSKDFSVDDNLIIIKSKKGKIEYSTIYTMIDLEYNAYDVADALGELTIEEYSETLFDKDDDNPKFLFVFGKGIDSRLIYIKLKIRDKSVICVSFHYAKRDMDFPYRKS